MLSWHTTEAKATEQLVDLKQTTACVPAEDKYTHTHTVTYSTVEDSLCLLGQCSQPGDHNPHKRSQH